MYELTVVPAGEQMTISSTINPAPWLVDVFGAGRAASGVTVNSHTVLTSGAFYAAVSGIASDLAQLWVEVIEHAPKDPRTDRRKMSNHAIGNIWNWNGNHEMAPFDVRQTLLQSKLLHGNGIGVIQYENGRPVGVYPIDPQNVWPDRLPMDPDLGPLSRAIIYRVTDPQLGMFTFFQNEVFHLKLMGNGLWGYSPLALFRDLIGNGLGRQQFIGHSYRNGARPGGIIETDKPRLSDETKATLRAEWEELHRGVGNANRVGILVDGMKFNPMQVTNQEAELIALGDQYVEEVARIYRIPPPKLQQLKNLAVRANQAELNRQYKQDALQPHAVQFEQESCRKLTNARERQRCTVTCHHDFRAFLRTDTKEQNEGFAVGRQWGWLSANDVLRELDQPEIGKAGDIYLVPSNMANAETGEPFAAAAQPPERSPPTEPAEPESGEAAQMLLRQELIAVMKAAGYKFRDWIERDKPPEAEQVAAFMSAERQNVTRRLTPYVGEQSAAIAEQWVQQLTGDLGRIETLGDLCHCALQWPKIVELLAVKAKGEKACLPTDTAA